MYKRQVNDRPKLDLNEEIADDANPQFVQVMNSSPKHRQIVELALMLQGRISGESQHASAYIVSPIKLDVYKRQPGIFFDTGAASSAPTL